jgi:hypothetical protein
MSDRIRSFCRARSYHRRWHRHSLLGCAHVVCRTRVAQLRATAGQS